MNLVARTKNGVTTYTLQVRVGKGKLLEQFPNRAASADKKACRDAGLATIERKVLSVKGTGS